MKIHPVIMCGGAGTRLWPLSTKETPKQYLLLLGDSSLLTDTLRRVSQAPAGLEIASPVLICGAGQETSVREAVAAAGMNECTIVIEPEGRDTAPVAATAALLVSQRDPDGHTLLLPADHYVGDVPDFWNSLAAGVSASQAGEIVTLGIEPTEPSTAYGYIERGAGLGAPIYRIAQFREKPDEATAQEFLDTGKFFWNAGIFLFRADTMVREFETLAPETLSACQDAITNASRIDDVINLDRSAFARAIKGPVDRVIMEKTQHAAVVAPVRAAWSDIGSWTALADLLNGPNEGKNSVTSGDVLQINCSGGMIRSDGPFVATIGLKDIIVVAGKNGILILHKDHSQDVKKVVEHLKAEGRTDLL